MKPIQIDQRMDDSSESGKKSQRPSRILSSLRRNVNVFRSATASSQVLEPHETRPFLSTSASASSAQQENMTIHNSHNHAVAAQNKGSNFEIYSVRDRRDATAKRAFKVQVPKKMLYYTMTVFLVLPLALFLWKEMHLDNHHESHNNRQYPPELAVKSNGGHDFYPTWMEDAVGSVLTTTSTVMTTASNDTTTTSQDDDAGGAGGGWDEESEFLSNNNSNNTSGLPDDVVVTDELGDSLSLSSVVVGTEKDTATGKDAADKSSGKKIKKSASGESPAELAHDVGEGSVSATADVAEGAENHDITTSTVGGDGGDADTDATLKLASSLADKDLESLAAKERLAGTTPGTRRSLGLHHHQLEDAGADEEDDYENLGTSLSSLANTNNSPHVGAADDDAIEPQRRRLFLRGA
jgi:hypothetical protein